MKKNLFIFGFICLLFSGLGFRAPVDAQTSSGPGGTVEFEEISVNNGEINTLQTGFLTVNFKGADIRAVLNYVSDVAGVDIVPSPDVIGNVSMRLTNKPWEVALDILARNYGYVLVEEKGVIRVVPKDALEGEETVTEVITLQYIVPERRLRRMEDALTVSETYEESSTHMAGVQILQDTIQSILAKNESVYFVSSANAFVVTAIPARINKIKEMIEAVDVVPKQIMLEAKIIEIQLGDDQRMGIDWNAVIEATGAARPISFPFDESGGIRALGDVLSNYLPETGAGDSPAASGFPYVSSKDETFASSFTYGTLDFSQFSATLSLIDNMDDSKMLASPKITTLNNQEAYISLTENVYLEKVTDSTYDNNTVATEFEDTPRQSGVVLQVIPHANEKGDISVVLRPTVGDAITFSKMIAGADGGDKIVMSYDSRTAHTRVMVKDRQTIFIGGLIKESTTMAEHKLPYLGDIFGDLPIFGNIFRYDQKTVTRTEVVIFVTVSLVENLDKFNAYATKNIQSETIHNALKEKSYKTDVDERIKHKKYVAPLFDFRKKKEK